MSIKKIVTLLGFLTMFAVGVSDLIVVGILSPMSQAFNVSPALLGQLVTIYAVSFATLSPILTKITTSLPNKKTLLVSLILFLLFTMLVTFVHSFFVLCILRILLAGCASLITVKLLSIGANLVSKTDKAKVVANIYIGFSAANILGIPLGTIFASKFSWKVPFYLIAITIFICFILIYLLIPNEPNKDKQTTMQKNYHIHNKKGIVIVLLFLLLMMVSTSLLFTYLDPIIRNSGHNSSIVSLALFLSGIGGVLGSKLGNILSEKVGFFFSSTIIIFAYIIALLILLLFSQSVLLVLLSIFMWNLFHWGTNPTVQYALLSFIKGDPSQIFSYNLSILNLGIGIGSLIGGILVTIDPEFHLSLYSAIFLALLSFLLLLSTKKR